MLSYSPDFAQAEITYRQELLRRSYQRPGLFRHLRRTAQTPVSRPHLVRARHAM